MLLESVSKNTASSFGLRYQGWRRCHEELSASFSRGVLVLIVLFTQVCHIFGLDADMRPDVNVMKRGLLKLLLVREFSEPAQFANPSRSLVLPDLFCQNPLCSASRDVDLCSEFQIHACCFELKVLNVDRFLSFCNVTEGRGDLRHEF